jgi:hypothetical protein
MKKEREFKNMSEKKLYCYRCGNEINKYAYAEAVITSNIIVEDEKVIQQTDVINFCLKCFLPRRSNILELIRNEYV